MSSTLRRDFRNATRFALLAAAEEANPQSSNNDVSPVDKRRQASLIDFSYRSIPVPHVATDERGRLLFLVTQTCLVRIRLWILRIFDLTTRVTNVMVLLRQYDRFSSRQLTPPRSGKMRRFPRTRQSTTRYRMCCLLDLRKKMHL